MSHSAKRTRRTTTVAMAVVAVGVLVALTACGSDDSRAAASVSASTSGTVVTDSTDDLGSIIIGWGEKHSDTEITTPKPEDVTARCTGNGDNLAVNISAPHGWKIKASNSSQVLTVENAEQKIAGDIDTSHRFLEALHSVDWSSPDQVDINVVADAPAEWNPPHGTGHIYLSLHVDCA
ncbi:hypothetical protein [Rhodococcus sp. IEGM 1379]|uniref:hypothetical protein n=1 Tax=Rhodococcus sp. IEGM 1379 TaxID=3047086 RepID=UPI0024B7C09F|nr:hypothetical protein [Rhodococcus sp. IEGM 1379]MDI9915405.1 hypothetical protein [Rhodococcus sp. IEGM 1379]